MSARWIFVEGEETLLETSIKKAQVLDCVTNPIMKSYNENLFNCKTLRDYFYTYVSLYTNGLVTNVQAKDELLCLELVC